MLSSTRGNEAYLFLFDDDDDFDELLDDELLDDELLDDELLDPLVGGSSLTVGRHRRGDYVRY